MPGTFSKVVVVVTCRPPFDEAERERVVVLSCEEKERW